MSPDVSDSTDSFHPNSWLSQYNLEKYTLINSFQPSAYTSHKEKFGVINVVRGK